MTLHGSSPWLLNETETIPPQSPGRGGQSARGRRCRFRARLWQGLCPAVESEAVRARKGPERPLQVVRKLRVRAEGPKKTSRRIPRVASDSGAGNAGIGRSRM